MFVKQPAQLRHMSRRRIRRLFADKALFHIINKATSHLTYRDLLRLPRSVRFNLVFLRRLDYTADWKPHRLSAYVRTVRTRRDWRRSERAELAAEFGPD